MMLLTAVKKVVAGSAVVGAAAGVTWIATGPVVAVALAEPRAWIDEPLDGAVMPPGEEVTIVAHATDPDGVELVTLRIDGHQVDARTGGGGALATVEFAWVPSAEGEHALEVRGRDDADFGAPGLATVTVADAADPDPDDPGEPAEPDDEETTTTTVPADVTTTTAPADPTTTRPVVTVPSTPSTTRPPPPTTQCQRPPPTLVGPTDRASLRTSPTLTWAYQGCAVDGFRVQAARSPGGVPIASSPTLAPTVRRWAPADGFPCDGRPVYWRVATLDGRDLRWSGLWSFTC